MSGTKLRAQKPAERVVSQNLLFEFSGRRRELRRRGFTYRYAWTLAWLELRSKQKPH